MRVLSEKENHFQNLLGIKEPEPSKLKLGYMAPAPVDSINLSLLLQDRGIKRYVWLMRFLCVSLRFLKPVPKKGTVFKLSLSTVYTTLHRAPFFALGFAPEENIKDLRLLEKK